MPSSNLAPTARRCLRAQDSKCRRMPMDSSKILRRLLSQMFQQLPVPKQRRAEGHWPISSATVSLQHRFRLSSCTTTTIKREPVWCAHSKDLDPRGAVFSNTSYGWGRLKHHVEHACCWTIQKCPWNSRNKLDIPDNGFKLSSDHVTPAEWYLRCTRL